jgi:hypothetical protein
MSIFCGKVGSLDGAPGTFKHSDGYPGKPGKTGMDARSRQPLKVYVILSNVVVKAGNPSSARLLNLDFDGVQGDGGSDGCKGGRGGAGLDAGPGSYAGNSGLPGAGGPGGAAAQGQNGANFSWYIDPKLANTVAFFVVSVEGGKPGIPGRGAICGPTGRAGAGWGLRKGGNGIGCAQPVKAPDGATASMGDRGSIYTVQGNFGSVLP